MLSKYAYSVTFGSAVSRAVQVSEVDIYGRVLATFSDVNTPVYLTMDNESRLMIADSFNNRILLLNSQLQLLHLTTRFFFFFFFFYDYDYHYHYHHYYYYYYHLILLLNSQLQLLHILVDSNADIELSKPKQLCYDELTSQLYILHGSNAKRRTQWSDTITEINLR